MELTHYAAEPLEYNPAAGYLQSPPVIFGKPAGLWVSADGDDDWPAWCEAEKFATEKLSHAYTVTLTPTANVLHIDTAQGIDAFHNTYSVEDDELSLIRARRGSEFDPIDWRVVAATYDGVVISPYQWSRRHTPHWYYGWDCASGCIWNLSAIERVSQAAIGRMGKK